MEKKDAERIERIFRNLEEVKQKFHVLNEEIASLKLQIRQLKNPTIIATE